MIVAPRVLSKTPLLPGAAAIVLLTLVVYWPALAGDFVWDDNWLIVGSPMVQDRGGLVRTWVSRDQPDYFPLTYSLWWVQWRLWHGSPVGFHIVNAMLHAASAVLLWRVLNAAGIPAAFLAAIAFAVHPVNVETAAWISQTKNTLPMVFMLLSLLAWSRFERSPRSGWYAVSLACFMLALLAKTSVVMMPLVLVLWSLWQRQPLRTIACRTGPFFGASLALGLLTMQFQHASSIADMVRTDGPLSRTLGAAAALGFYLLKALWPRDLLFVYPRWSIDPASVLWYLPLAGLVMVVLVLIAVRRTWTRVVLLALSCYAAMLLPVLGFWNISYMRFSLVADHWQYHAMPFVLALVAGGGAWLFAEMPTWLRLGLAAAWVTMLSIWSFHHAAVFRSERALWTDTVQRNPGAFLAQARLGLVHAGAGDWPTAVQFFRAALAVKEDFADAHHNLADALVEMGQMDEAVRHYRRAIEINSGYGRRSPDLARNYSNLGRALMLMGRLDEAAAALARAVEVDPRLPSPHNRLGYLCLQQGRMDEAIAHFREAIRVAPRSPDGHYNLANALAARGDYARAVEHFQAALALDGNYLDARQRLEQARAAGGLPRP